MFCNVANQFNVGGPGHETVKQINCQIRYTTNSQSQTPYSQCYALMTSRLEYDSNSRGSPLLPYKGLLFADDSWSKIRNGLMTHVRSTISMENEDGKIIKIRATSKPNDYQTKIYTALGVSMTPGKKKVYRG